MKIAVDASGYVVWYDTLDDEAVPTGIDFDTCFTVDEDVLKAKLGADFFSDIHAPLIDSLRVVRDRELASSDWIGGRHDDETLLLANGDIVETTLTDTEILAYATYRNALRAIPTSLSGGTDSAPIVFSWPTKPSFVA